jgi:hypothetical protein
MMFAPLMVQSAYYYSAWEKRLAHHRGDAVLALYRRDHKLYVSELLIGNDEAVIFPVGRWDIFFVMYDGEYPSIRGRHVPPELMQFKFDGVHLHELKPIPFRKEPFSTNNIQSVEDYCEYHGWFPTKPIALDPKAGIVCFFLNWWNGVQAAVYGPGDFRDSTTYSLPGGLKTFVKDDLMIFVKQFGLPCFIEAEHFGPSS